MVPVALGQHPRAIHVDEERMLLPGTSGAPVARENACSTRARTEANASRCGAVTTSVAREAVSLSRVIDQRPHQDHDRARRDRGARGRLRHFAPWLEDVVQAFAPCVWLRIGNGFRRRATGCRWY